MQRQHGWRFSRSSRVVERRRVRDASGFVYELNDASQGVCVEFGTRGAPQTRVALQMHAAGGPRALCRDKIVQIDRNIDVPGLIRGNNGVATHKSNIVSTQECKMR
jgi:hypothetical protein